MQEEVTNQLVEDKLIDECGVWYDAVNEGVKAPNFNSAEELLLHIVQNYQMEKLLVMNDEALTELERFMDVPMKRKVWKCRWLWDCWNLWDGL